MSFPKKAAFYAILALIVLVAAEIASSAFLFLAYRDQIASLSGEPLTPSTVLVLRKGLNWLLPGSAPDPLPYRRMSRIPQDFFGEDAERLEFAGLAGIEQDHAHVCGNWHDAGFLYPCLDRRCETPESA